MGIIVAVPALSLFILLYQMVLVLDTSLFSDWRNLQGNVSRAFSMFSSITMMKMAVWFGLVNNTSLPPPLSFVSSSTSCNLLQISGLIHSSTHFHHLDLFCVTPCVPIQQRLVITIATAACDALRSLRNKALALEKKNHTHINLLHEILFHGVYEGNCASD